MAIASSPKCNAAASVSVASARASRRGKDHRDQRGHPKYNTLETAATLTATPSHSHHPGNRRGNERLGRSGGCLGTQARPSGNRS
eukprot:2899080-Pleurochrysis_carterae.AAC.1